VVEELERERLDIFKSFFFIEWKTYFLEVEEEKGGE
jgi:hypothetical protein